MIRIAFCDDQKQHLDKMKGLIILELNKLNLTYDIETYDDGNILLKDYNKDIEGLDFKIYLTLDIAYKYKHILLVLINQISRHLQEENTMRIIINSQKILKNSIVEIDNKEKTTRKIKHDMLNHFGIFTT